VCVCVSGLVDILDFVFFPLQPRGCFKFFFAYLQPKLFVGRGMHEDMFSLLK